MNAFATISLAMYIVMQVINKYLSNDDTSV